MKKVFLIFSVVIFSLLTSCIQNSDEQYDVEDFQNDNESYYKEYEDEDEVSDEDMSSAVWDVNFSFLGTINNGELNDGNTVAADTGSDSGETGDDDDTNDDDTNTNTPENPQNIIYGSGLLTYVNLLNETVTINSSSWALKKALTLASGHQVPIIQVFFADNSSNTDEDGYVTYFILQLEGSSVSSKSETYYLNNDKLYKAKVKLDAKGNIGEICYIQEPDSTKGKVNIYTSNIRIGEELKVDGYADMLDMEIKECKVMN